MVFTTFSLRMVMYAMADTTAQVSAMEMAKGRPVDHSAPRSCAAALSSAGFSPPCSVSPNSACGRATRMTPEKHSSAAPTSCRPKPSRSTTAAMMAVKMGLVKMMMVASDSGMCDRAQ